MLNSAHLLMKHALTCCLNFAQSFKTCQSSLALGFICPALPTLDDSDPDPGPPLAWNPRIALATLWPPLTARPHYPSLHTPRAPPRLGPTQDYPTGSAHLTRPDTARLLRTPSPLSPLFYVCLSSQPPRALPPFSPSLICSVSLVSPCLARLSHRAAIGPPIMGRPVPAPAARAFGIPHRSDRT
jgi:hypothetical protein